ncbi:response regulator [bacterium]|nr:response regulator [bacterium]
MNEKETKPCILVVDDTPENIDVAGGILSGLYKVKAAISGEKALKIAGKKPPDLILLDVMMPEMDGYEVCQRLKQDENTHYIPVIFVTGETDAEAMKKGLELGAVDYVTKPIDAALLLEKVKNYVAS